MAVKIRLRRQGAKKCPFYKVVVADSRSPRDGKFIEQVGTYNPMTTPKEVIIDGAKVKEWISKGAKPTDTVRVLCVKEGILEPAKGKTAPAIKVAKVVEPVAVKIEEPVVVVEEPVVVVEPEVEIEG